MKITAKMLDPVRAEVYVDGELGALVAPDASPDRAAWDLHHFLALRGVYTHPRDLAETIREAIREAIRAA